MTVVRFAAYRAYEEARVTSSNAMMALLAGAQLASHLLQLSNGSSRLLPEMYPQVPHIGRFNLTSDAARTILDAADSHLGAMGVPYALALHEDYMKTCLLLLERAQLCPPRTAERTKLFAQHARVASAAGGTFNADSIAQLNTLRMMRNCLIHEGSRADPKLINHVANWSPSTEVGWVKLAKRSPRTLRVGDHVMFGQAEMILTLAITKKLDREANEMLQAPIPRTLWADIVVEDLMTNHPGGVRAPDKIRRLRGLARYHYSPLQLTEPELTAALARV